MKEKIDAATHVKQVLENRKQIDSIIEQKEKDRQLTQQEEHRIKYDVYDPKIRALERERDALIAEMQAKHEAGIAEQNREITDLSQVIEQAKRILEFLRVQPKDLIIDDNDIKVPNGQYKENLGFLFRDEHLQIKLYIAENNKPKNKYSLLAFGKCSFNDVLWKRRYSYGLCTYESSWYSLKEVVRDFPSVEEAKNWLATKRRNLVQELLGDYRQVVKEYLTVKKTYKVDDFAQLLKLKCEKCRYFYTIFDEISTRKEAAKCPKCGEIMLEVKP